jgi:hypothetical protein
LSHLVFFPLDDPRDWRMLAAEKPMSQTPPQIFEDYEAGRINRAELHAAMAEFAQPMIEDMIDAHGNPLANWWDSLLAKQVALRLTSRNGERRVREVLAALSEVPDFPPARWLWNAEHPDMPLFCFFRMRRHPLFRVKKIETIYGKIHVDLDYTHGPFRQVEREHFIFRQPRYGAGMEMLERSPA